MRNISSFFKLLFVSILLINCSGDGNDAPSNPVVIPATVVTDAPENVTGLDVTLKGKITVGSLPVYSFGFCVGPEANPTISDRKYETSGSPEGDYALTIMSPKPNSLFHVRAYAQIANGSVYYGNDQTYTSAFPITSTIPTRILPKSALFRGNVVSLPQNHFGMGYCYNTLPNPTISNENFAVDGLGQFENYQEALQPNTTYFARPYCTIEGQIYYGAEISFKTTGYFGPAGGYVIYDKGDMTDGWRYLEIYPQTLSYNISFTTGALWGCSSSFLSNTYPEVGSGLANTQRIVNTCTSANCAARLCDNYSHGGYSDWFLGSRDEMLMASKGLNDIGVSIGSSWTSTELTSVYANTIGWDSSYDYYNFYQGFKSNYSNVFPMRRY